MELKQLTNNDRSAIVDMIKSKKPQIWKEETSTDALINSFFRMLNRPEYYYIVGSFDDEGDLIATIGTSFGKSYDNIMVLDHFKTHGKLIQQNKMYNEKNMGIFTGMDMVLKEGWRRKKCFSIFWGLRLDSPQVARNTKSSISRFERWEKHIPEFSKYTSAWTEAIIPPGELPVNGLHKAIIGTPHDCYSIIKVRYLKEEFRRELLNIDDNYNIINK